MGTRVAILTGAGISTAAGIPDFRGPDGLWTTRPDMRDAFEIGVFMTHPKVRAAVWSWLRESMDTGAGAGASYGPTAAHRALERLHIHGMVAAMATQNIDSLHELAGTTDVLHLHGRMDRSRCHRCGVFYATTAVMGSLDAEPDPHCRRWNPKKGKPCGGVIRPDIVFFGEDLPRRAFHGFEDAIMVADEFWAIGTSLKVEPVASLMGEAISVGIRTRIFNGAPTPFDDEASEVVRGRIDDTVPTAVDALIKAETV